MSDVMTSILMVLGVGAVAYAAYLGARYSLDWLCNFAGTVRAAARLTRDHPNAEKMSRLQMANTFAVLATQRPGPQLSDQWAA